MHYGSYKCSHMKLKDNNFFCPYNVAVSEMNGSSTVTKKQTKQTKNNPKKGKSVSVLSYLSIQIQSLDCKLLGEKMGSPILQLRMFSLRYSEEAWKIPFNNYYSYSGK